MGKPEKGGGRGKGNGSSITDGGEERGTKRGKKNKKRGGVGACRNDSRKGWWKKDRLFQNEEKVSWVNTVGRVITLLVGRPARKSSSVSDTCIE